jgi:pimeloyl-ACP methyl ester carboxylesterase
VDREFRASDGTRLHYVAVGGQGSTVVLLHGLGTDARITWMATGVAEALSAHHRVLAIDLRGHGESDKPHDPARYGHRLWLDVLELMDTLGVSRAHVHGYSLGGTLVRELVARHPERWLSASFGGAGVPETDSLAAAPAEPTPPDTLGESAARTEARRLAVGRDEAAINALLASAPQGRTAFDLATLRLPLLAIVGEYDRPLWRTQRLRREAPDFTLVVLRGKSHLTAALPGYMPPEYTSALGRFIDAHDATR